MDFDNESLLRCFVTEEEQKEIVEWCKSNDHERSDIFEYRLEEADKLKDEGNALYKQGECEQARHRYYAAIWHLDFDIGQQWNMMDHHQLDLNTRKLKVLSNICASYMKGKDWVKTKEAADIGLRHIQKAELKDKDAEAKFYYRKGFANLQRGFSEDAVACLKKADEAKPSDPEIRSALKEASRGQKEDQKKSKAVWRDKLLSQEEKEAQGPIWQPKSLLARLRLSFRACCRRKPLKSA
mmetsp:Transcript_30731/g.46414  ORF Transcript_30731/g.46414 Transcript_30731/m.46414 type:complete len:239 (+) Transcript_30731:64-780(+)